MVRSSNTQWKLRASCRLCLGLLLVSCLTVCSGQPQRARVAATPNIDSSELATLPSPEVAFIIGPQLRMGSKLNPYPWFDSIQLSRGTVHGREFPRTPPLQLAGTVQVQKGDPIVRGVGTKFLSQVDSAGPAPFFNGRLRIREGSSDTYRQVQVRSVQSDTQLTLTAPYAYASQSGVQADTEYLGAGNINGDVYINANYYDLALCLYVLYYRTGDPQHLAAARKVADSWWLSSPIKSGTSREFDTASYSPRNASLGGLMLRALDGRPEMWDWLHAYTRQMYDLWIKRHLNDPQLYQGVRDGSFLVLYATWLGKVLPDSFPLQAGGNNTNGASLRAGLLADAENAAVNYFGRLQSPDGSWRWDDGYYKDADGGTLQGVMQPFMVGLLMQTLVEVHRASTRTPVKENVKSQLMKICQHLYNGGPYRKNDTALPGIRWRTFHYFFHGGTTVNPRKYSRGDGATATAQWEVQSARQLLATIIPAYGYVYQITGDELFKTMGDDLFESAFGDVTDGIHNEAAGTARNYNQNYRMGGRYIAWRVGAQQSVISNKPLPPTETLASASNASPKTSASARNAPPITVVSAAEMVAAVFSTANNLASATSLDADQVKELVTQIEQTRDALTLGKAKYVFADKVLIELQAALKHSRNALSMLQSESGYKDDAKTRVEWATARLKRAAEHLTQK